MLQVRENMISLRKWSGCTAQLRFSEGTVLAVHFFLLLSPVEHETARRSNTVVPKFLSMMSYYLQKIFFTFQVENFFCSDHSYNTDEHCDFGFALPPRRIAYYPRWGNLPPVEEPFPALHLLYFRLCCFQQLIAPSLVSALH